MKLETLFAQQAAPGWLPFWREQASAPYLAALDRFLCEEQKAGAVFPPPADLFRAFALPPEQVRVVILGQDPYHEPGQAMGLAFSVREGVKPPPSLRNICKELAEDCAADAAGTDLTPWAEQGVFLLNTTLTVRQGAANSHAGHGWETFTRAAVQYVLNAAQTPVAAVLWGKNAQAAAPLFQAAAAGRPVLVLQSAHPSPLSAYRGFFGSRPFSRVNAFFAAQGQPAIDWALRRQTV